MSAPQLSGAILCGGASSRMGRNKALVAIDGIPMIERVRRALRTVVDDLVLVTDDPQPYTFLNLPSIPDMMRAAGPLSAVHAAVSRAAHERVIIVACDFPMITPAIFTTLLLHDAAIVVPVVDGRVQPLCGVYHRDVAGRIAAMLAAGERSVQPLLRESHTTLVDLSAPLSAQLRNVNTPADLQLIVG